MCTIKSQLILALIAKINFCEYKIAFTDKSKDKAEEQHFNFLNLFFYSCKKHAEK